MWQFIVLCYFVVALAKQCLAPGTIKAYLAAMRHAQIVEDLPDVRQTAIATGPDWSAKGTRLPGPVSAHQAANHPRPIEPAIALCRVWLNPPASFDNVMFWAAASACFFGFFRAGEITIPSDMAVCQGHSSVVGMVPLSQRPALWRQSARPCCRQGYHRRAIRPCWLTGLSNTSARQVVQFGIPALHTHITLTSSPCTLHPFRQCSPKPAITVASSCGQPVRG